MLLFVYVIKCMVTLDYDSFTKPMNMTTFIEIIKLFHCMMVLNSEIQLLRNNPVLRSRLLMDLFYTFKQTVLKHNSPILYLVSTPDLTL